MAGQQQERPVGSQRGREGARWINQRPTSEEIAAWFKDNVPMHDALKDHPERYVGGLTLIPSKDYVEEPRERNGNVFLTKVINQVFTPYCKVETRVQYFWDLMAAKPDWIGMIEPVTPVGQPQARTLPPGFFYANYKDGQNRDVTFVCCTMRVRVIEREGAEWVDAPERWDGGRKTGGGRILQGIPVIEGPPATKMIPVLTSKGYGQNAQIIADPFSLMKAETGATGRALGLAGMLVVPGTGVATAEDMLEAASQGAPPASDGGADASLPEVPAAAQEPGDGLGEAEAAAEGKSPLEILQGEVEAKIKRLEEEKPEAHQEFQRWAREDRGFKDFSSLNESQLRGVSRKLDRDLSA